MDMLDMACGPFDKLLSCDEAAAIWNVDSSTIRKAITSGRFEEGRDCRKFGKQWVVTADAMHREFRGGWEPWSNYLSNLRKTRLTKET